jgi:hypothetical protein
MAEGGGIEGLLAEENEGADADAGVAAADDAALAVTMEAAKTNPDVSEGVLAYLEK